MEAAVAAMTRVVEVRDPDRDATRVRRCTDVYLRMYPALRPLYASIRRITGYPPR